MSDRIVVNVSTSADWRRRPVGIVRVERELIKAIFRNFPDRITPIYLDRIEDHWRGVDRECLEKMISDDWVEGRNPDLDALEIRQHLTRFSPSPADQFVTVGSDWSFNVPERVEAMYGSNRVLIPACYDLIPWLFPEFTPDAGFYDQFERHYSAIARLARTVFAISQTSSDSLQEFWQSKGLKSIAPPIEVIPLAGAPSKTGAERLSDQDSELIESLSKDGPVIMYVSTVEPRKNHQILIDIWRELFAERGDNCPKLLIIGMRGWGSTDLIESIDKMDATKAGRIVWAEGISDNVLNALYKRCAFTVFPSYFEGWGLAATEALSKGKICIISKTGALIEATQGSMPSYHPLDFPGWKTEIIRLLDDEEYKRGIESNISDTLFSRTWADFGDDFCRNILDR